MANKVIIRAIEDAGLNHKKSYTALMLNPKQIIQDFNDSLFIKQTVTPVEVIEDTKTDVVAEDIEPTADVVIDDDSTKASVDLTPQKKSKANKQKSK